MSCPRPGLGPMTHFLHVPENYIADLEKKIGRSANGGGGGVQPFNSQHSLTDHRKILMFPYNQGVSQFSLSSCFEVTLPHILTDVKTAYLGRPTVVRFRMLSNLI